MSRSTLAVAVRHLRAKLACHERSKESDEQLLHAFLASRDDNAFAVLVGHYGPMVLHVCRRVLGHEQDAEDAFQATFLVLAQSPASLRNKTALASFLYGTAYRIAMKAKQSAARRRKHEGQAPARPAVNPSEELSWREVRSLVDGEVARLPEKYRSAFILCCLESVNQAEAARRLGLKEGTLSSRLTTARKLLSQRLARRGVELTAVLATSTIAAHSASALSPLLIATTIKAALGEGTGGVISASVAEMAKGVAAAAIAHKTKIAALILLTVALLGGAGVCFLARGQRQQGHPLQALRVGEQTAQTLRSEKRESAKTVDIHGRVLGPDGKPKAGAKLLLFDEIEIKNITELGVTAADGGFTVAIPKKAKGLLRLIARTEDAGIDFLYAAHLKPGKPVELRLVKDRPIRGQIVTTEGKPVAGARATVRLIRAYANNSLDSFPTAWAKRRGNSEIPECEKILGDANAYLFAAVTDVDGRFAIRGIGAERVLGLRIDGPGIATTERWVINHDGFDARPYNHELNNRSPGKVFYGPWILMSGPDVSLVAEREKILRGMVKDAETGKGIAGATVCLTGKADHGLLGGLLAYIPRARTDGRGYYEMRGAPKLKAYLLQVMKDPATGYPDKTILAEDAIGYQPLTVDITVKKGVIVTGRIIDKSTGKPLPGSVETVILNGNPFAKDYLTEEEYGLITEEDFSQTRDDGTFRELVIPGPVLLIGHVDLSRLPGGEVEGLGFKDPLPDPKFPEYFRVEPNGKTNYIGLNGVPGAVHGKTCKVLIVKPGTAVVHQDLFVERASARTVNIQDADGKPLAHVWAVGLRADRNGPVRLNGDSCPAYALEANKPRLMVFYEPSKKLAGSLLLTANDKEPFAARLGPAGSIRGRLLDADGKPVAGVMIDVHYRDREASAIHEIIDKAKQAVTDANGAFTLEELLPELKLELIFHQGQRRFEREPKPAKGTIQMKPGECRDLGTIRTKPQQ
jgi:RNA polymerase sigma factor (sigma-70 family)